jgi:peroxiredoxin family protein
MIMASAIEKVSIIVSKRSLGGIYPALIMANGARAEGIEANLFFTFFGLDAITKKRSTSSSPPSAIPACTWPPSSAACPACPA